MKGRIYLAKGVRASERMYDFGAMRRPRGAPWSARRLTVNINVDQIKLGPDFRYGSNS